MDIPAPGEVGHPSPPPPLVADPETAVALVPGHGDLPDVSQPGRCLADRPTHLPTNIVEKLDAAGTLLFSPGLGP